MKKYTVLSKADAGVNKAARIELEPVNNGTIADALQILGGDNLSFSNKSHMIGRAERSSPPHVSITIENIGDLPDKLRQLRHLGYQSARRFGK